ncbi:MAG: phosphatase PAP2-related protein [Candidatus Kapabacteria bacterium]|nr:phosphatase PAP2-related protein [Candidatus Kapabacteria bacterium]
MLSQNIKDIWKIELSNKYFLPQVILSFMSVIVGLFFFTRFLAFIEARPGIILPDPILAWFSPVDISWFTFIVMYSMIIIAIISLIQSPKALILGLQSYTVMLIIRTAAMYSIPLEAPATILPLIDPMVSEIGVGQLMTKDLFFSGHTATIFIMYLVAQKKPFRIFFLVTTIVIGLAVLLQHVHYSVDVIAAPFFGYGAYKIVYLLNHKFNPVFRNIK